MEAASLTLNGGAILVVGGIANEGPGTPRPAATLALGAHTLSNVGAPVDGRSPPDRRPTFGVAVVEARTYMVGTAIAPLELPAARGGDWALSYAVTPALSPGLTHTLPADATSCRTIAGTPTEETPATTYTLTATDVDGDTATLPFSIEVVRIPVQVTLTDATAAEGGVAEFAVALSRMVPKPLTFHWTASRPGSATPGEDYQAEGAGRLTLAAGTTAEPLRVPTLDGRRVEPVETFTVTVTLPGDPVIQATDVTAEGRIEDDDTEQARKRSLGTVLAGVDAGDGCGGRDRRAVHPAAAKQLGDGGRAGGESA